MTPLSSQLQNECCMTSHLPQASVVWQTARTPTQVLCNCCMRMQAAFHAVPMVGIPLIADQLDNVMKAVHRGFGLAVSPKGGLRADEIAAALNTVLSEPDFKEAALKLSKRLRSRTRTPTQEAAGRSPTLHCCCTVLHTC